MSFTPGPWSAVKRERIGFAEWQVAWSPDGELVCDIVYEEADAQLIAAAPELLAALQDLLPLVECDHDEPDECVWARAAIAKATQP